MESPDPTPPTPGAPAPKSRRKIAVGGAIFGVLALLLGLLALSTGAGAQDTPVLSDDADAAVAQADEADVDEPDDELDADELDELEFDDFDEFDADFAAFDACLESQLGIDFETSDDAAFDAIDDAAWEAAEEACADQLPPEILEMEAAWERFDQCLADNGIDVEEFDDGIDVEEFDEDSDIDVEEFDEDSDIDDLADFPPTVFVETPDEFSIAEFGEGDGSIVITQSNGAISVTVDGDVELTSEPFEDFEIDEDWEAAFEACESELPEDAFIDEIFEGDIDDLDDLFFDDDDVDEDELEGSDA